MTPDIAIDWARFHIAKQALGNRFDAAIQWFHEDGTSAIAAIERAMTECDAMAIIRTAGLLKTDAMQIGALCVSEHADACENAARDCIDVHSPWTPLHQHARALRNAHTATISLFEEELKAGQRRVA